MYPIVVHTGQIKDRNSQTDLTSCSSCMQDRDVLFQILLRVDYDTLVALYECPINKTMRDVFRISHFWKKGAEAMHSVDKPFRDNKEVNWRTIYKVARHLEEEVFETHDSHRMFLYSLTDVPTMKMVVDFTRPPTYTDLCNIWIMGPSIEIAEYLTELRPKDMARAAADALYSSTRAGAVDLCKFLLRHPVTREHLDIPRAFSMALEEETLPLIRLYAPLVLKAYYTRHALKAVKKHSLLVVVSMFDNDVHSPTIHNLKAAINAGRIETVLWLLDRVSPASKTNSCLLCAARIGEMMFRVVLSHASVDPSIHPEIVLAALLKNTLTPDTTRWVLLEDSRFDASSVSTEELSQFMFLTARWLPQRTTKLLEVSDQSREELLSIARDMTATHSLLNFLLQNRASPTEVLDWMRHRLTSLDVRDAVTSVAKNTVLENEQADPIRALLFALIYPEMSVSKHLSFLKKEGVSYDNMVLSHILMAVYSC